MHAVKVDSRKIMAIGLVIVAAFAAVAITTNLFYLGKIQSLVRSTTTTSVMELATARARYLDECLTTDQNSVRSLAQFIAYTPEEDAADQVREFISTHEAAAAWVRSVDGEVWCSRDEPNLYPADREEELFGPALAGETGSSEVYPGLGGERRILFYAPIVKASKAAMVPAAGRADQTDVASAADGEAIPDDDTAGAATTGIPAPVDPADVVGAVYVSYPADDLQNSYGTAYSSSGAAFVVDAGGTIVLDANRGGDDAVQGSLAALLADDGADGDASGTALPTDDNEGAVASLLAGIASNSSGSLTLALDGAEQFVFYTPIDAKDGWSFVTILPLSVVEADGAQIVGLTTQMVGVLAVAVALAVAAMAALVMYRRRREHRYEQYLQSVYRAIGANIDTAIFIVDAEEHVVEAVFENTQDILGVPAQKFFAVDALSANEAYAKVAAIVHSSGGERRCWEFEADNPALGRAMWLRMTARPVTLADRAKTIFSLTDVTDEHDARARLQRAAEAADEANRAKSNFLSSMSHDIRTPMNAILGFSTLIDREADHADAVRDYNRKIATSGQHLLGLINDVLDMSKIEAGKTTLAQAPFALSGTVAAVEAMMRQQTDAKEQTFTVEVVGVEHDRILGDEGRLRQVLMNLLSNAMKYTPQGGHILFRIDGSAKRRGALQHLRIIVRDDGIGMAPEYLARIFDSFTRAESSLTNKVQGTGLGMAITKNLVDLMGGTISVESAPGQGSTFIVDVDFPPASPAAAPEAREDDGAGAVGNALAGKHFLVAEDNDLNAEIISAILNINDATCAVAADGEEAVAKFSAAPAGTFDAIFMDVQMPVMNGHAATRAIRELDRADARTVPIVAMTANAFAEDEREALACGMNAHVAKPIDIKELQRVVAKLTETKKERP